MTVSHRFLSPPTYAGTRALVAGFALAVGSTASATLVYQTDFEAPTFPPNESVFGKDGWSANDNTWDVLSDGSNQFVTYNDANPVDNSPQPNGNINRDLGAQTDTLFLAVEVTFNNDEFIWFSFSDDTDDDNTLGLTIVEDNGDSFLRARARQGSSVNGNNVEINLGQDYLLVLKASKSVPSGNFDTAELFIDPGPTEPASADSVSVADTALSSFDTFRIRRGGSTDIPDVEIDNLRIATTYEALAIPEPGSFALLGTGGLFMMLRRRG